MYFHGHLSRSHNLRYPGCICLCCMLHRNTHLLAELWINYRFRCHHNPQDHTLILEYYNFDFIMPIRTVPIVILMFLRITSSRWIVQRSLQGRPQAQYSVEPCRNFNPVSCILNLKNRLLVKRWSTPYCKSYLSNCNFIYLTTCIRCIR